MRSPTASLRGLPILEQLDRIDVSNAKLLGALVVICAVLSGAVTLLLGTTLAAQPASTVGGLDLAFSVFNGAFMGANLGLGVGAARHLEETVGRAVAQDANFAASPEATAPLPGRTVMLGLMVLFVAQAWFRLYREVTSTIAADVDPGRMLFVLAPMAFNFLAGGLLVLALGYAVLRQRRIARAIEPDLRRVQQYACFALPALYLFGVYSIVLGAAAASVVLFDGTGEVVPAYLARTTSMLLIFLPLSLMPLWEIHRSIERTRNRERERVIRALNGDPEALRDSVVDRGAAERSDWMSHLLWLDTLPTWPLGAYLQRFLLFVLLPPVTWVMAAAVENLLF